MRLVPFALVAVMLMAAPTALAAPATGTFQLEGAWHLPEGAVLSLEAVGLFVADSAAIRRLEGSATSADVHVFRTTSVEAGVLSLAPEVESFSYTVTNLTFTLSEEPEAGWLGVRFPADRGDVAMVARSVVKGAPAAAGAAYGNDAQPPAAQDPKRRAYAVAAEDAHLSMEAEGVVQLAGGFAVKFQGPDLVLHADENRSHVETGYVRQPGAAIVEDTWAFVQFHDARLTLQSVAPLVLPSLAVEGDWSGPLRAKMSSGALETRSHRYLAAEGHGVIDGAFSGTLAASSEQATQIEMTGELRATNLASAARVAGPRAGIAAEWVLLVAGVLVAGTAVAAAAGIRRLRARPPSVDECVHRAGLAAEAGDYDEALQWCREGLRLAPASSRLLTDQGHFLELLGDHEAALDSYREAARASLEGEPEFLAFLLSRRLGAHEDAGRWLVAALQKAPSLVLEVEEIIVEPVSGDVERALRQAYRALDEEIS